MGPSEALLGWGSRWFANPLGWAPLNPNPPPPPLASKETGQALPAGSLLVDCLPGSILVDWWLEAFLWTGGWKLSCEWVSWQHPTCAEGQLQDRDRRSVGAAMHHFTAQSGFAG